MGEAGDDRQRRADSRRVQRARIVLTAVICEIARQWPSLINIDSDQEFIHNWVGYLVMMPLGLLMLWAEMALLSKLMLAPLPERPLLLGRFRSLNREENRLCQTTRCCP